MNIAATLGLKKKTSIEFNQEKNAMFNIFSQTRDKLSKLIVEQQLYVDEQTDVKLKAQKEIDLTRESMESSAETIIKLENFLN